MDDAGGLLFSGLVCAQNGPRNTMENFPEAVPSNRKVQMVSQDQEVYRVKYIKDVVYATRDGVDLKLQVMLPEAYGDPDRTYPCVVYVKGSAWMKQDIYSDVPQISRHYYIDENRDMPPVFLAHGTKDRVVP